MLKADLHTHTKGDPFDDLQYTPKDLIKLAAKQKFEVLSFTWHNKICDPKPLQSFAKKYGILLIPGIEATISGKHTLLYNITNKEMKKVKTHDDLYDLKDHVVIGAAHPFFILPQCLGRKVFEHPKLFDFMETSHLYFKHFNLNKKAYSTAKKFNIPVVANSDVHYLSMFGKDYTMIDAGKNKDDILDAIKSGKRINPITKPYSLKNFTKSVVTFAPAGVKFLLTKRRMEKKGFSSL